MKCIHVQIHQVTNSAPVDTFSFSFFTTFPANVTLTAFMVCNKTNFLLSLSFFILIASHSKHAIQLSEWKKERKKIQKKEKNSPELCVLLWISFIFFSWNVWSKQHLYHQSCILNSLFFSCLLLTRYLSLLYLAFSFLLSTSTTSCYFQLHTVYSHTQLLVNSN